ncbi:MAG: UDP-N-acetylmuramoyl-L-alanine--D-glutamate ligase, partial [Solobacterium sp.]|nr:UDP-N-acetylmuramoyl-L-alanine--D-glutamate ligase [Solobacterium sp.]
GIAAAKLLNEKGYEAIITDLKEIPEKEELEALGIRVYDGGHPDFLKEEKFDLIVKNPGIPDSAPFVKAMIDQGYFMYYETEIAARY